MTLFYLLALLSAASFTFASPTFQQGALNGSDEGHAPQEGVGSDRRHHPVGDYVAHGFSLDDDATYTCTSSSAAYSTGANVHTSSSIAIAAKSSSSAPFAFTNTTVISRPTPASSSRSFQTTLPGTATTAPIPSATELRPAVDWTIDRSDYGQLQLKNYCRMYYCELPLEPGEAPPPNAADAWLTMPNMKYPTVQLANSEHVEHASCSEREISIKFKDRGAYDFAWSDWNNQTGKYIVVTPEESCSGPAGDGEKHFVQAHNEVKDDEAMTITCEISWVPVSEANGEDNPVNVEFNNLLTNSGTSRADAVDTNNGRFVDPVDEQGNLRVDVSPNDGGFDRLRDAQIGRVTIEDFDQRLQQDYNITFDDFYGENDLPDVAASNLRKRGLFDRIKKAIKKVVKKVVQVVKKVVEVVKTVAKAVVEVAKQAIRLVTTGEVGGDFDTDISFGADVNVQQTPFGKEGLLMFEANAKREVQSNCTRNAPEGQRCSRTTEGSIKAFCVDCGAEGDFTVGGALDFKITEGLTKAELTATGSMRAGVSLGIVLEATDTFDFDRPIKRVPLTPFKIPGILDVGPFLALSAGASLVTDASGSLLAGVNVQWPDIEAVIDLVDRDNSRQSGFVPDIEKVFEAEGEISVTADGFLGFELGIGINILNGKFDQGVSVIDRPGLRLSASASASADLDGVTIGDEDCAGVDVGLTFTNEVAFDVFGREFSVSEFESPRLIDECIVIDLGDDDNNNLARRQAANATEEIAGTEFEGGRVAQIDMHDDDFRVRWSQNGNVYFVPPEKAPKVADGAKDWSGWFAADESGSLIVGDTHGRFFHAYVDTLAEFGVSRLRLHEPNQMPRTTEPLVFVATTPDENDGELPYLVLSDLAGDVYFPIMCEYEGEDIFPKLFVSNDTDAGPRTLESDAVRDTITGAKVQRCGYTPLTNNETGVSV